MSERHVCEPDRWPIGLNDVWTCPTCGYAYEAMDALADAIAHRLPLARHIQPGTLGWRRTAGVMFEEDRTNP